MKAITPEVLARLEQLEALVSSDWQLKHPDYEPFEVIANLDGGYGDDGTEHRYDSVCIVAEDLPGARALATAELIPLMRNNLKALLDAYKEFTVLITVRPASEYQDEYGDVLWWNFPVCEPPHFSSPSSSDWPGDRWSHFSRLPAVWGRDGNPRIVAMETSCPK